MMAPNLLLLSLAAAPAIGPAPDFKPPVPEVLTLASGAKAWVVTRPGLPLVHVGVCVPAGSLADPPGLPGLAALTAAALEEGGAGEKGPAEVLAAFDAQGTTLEGGVGGVCATYLVTTLASRLEPVLAQLVDVLARPRFDAAAFESVRRRQLAELAEAQDRPRTLSTMALMRGLFGDTPQGRMSMGEAAAVSRMTVADVRRFHEARYGAAGITFVLTGDVTAQTARRLLDQVAPKPWLNAPAPVVLPAPPPASSTWLGVDRPGLAQTQLLLGRVGVRADDPSVSALDLAATALGGSFTSRLNQNLREVHGYTYGAFSAVNPGRDFGVHLVMSAVRADVTGLALKETLGELRGLPSLSASEVAKARALLGAELVSNFQTGGEIANHLLFLLEDGLPADHASRQQAQLAAVTQAQVLAATAQFDPAGFLVVLVGDRATVEKQLQKEFPGQQVSWTAPR